MDGHRMDTPQLRGVEEVSGGWLKKFELRYAMEGADGKAHERPYEAIARKDTQAYRAELAANAARDAGADAAPLAPDAVAMAAVTADGRLVLTREFRYPLNAWVVELPAGLVEAGEDVVAAAVREMAEETGFAPLRRADGTPRARALPQAGLSSAGMTSESVQVVLMRVEDVPGPSHQEDVERIQTMPVDAAQAARLLEERDVLMDVRAQLALEAFSGAWDRQVKGL